MEVPDVAVNKSFINFVVMVALSLLIINALFDLVNVFTGKNFKGYFNKPVSTFYPGKSGTATTTSPAKSQSGS
jgi:hypothetical protein